MRVESWRLANGLKVSVRPQPGCGAVSVGVGYAVGFRDEPPGEGGFAHLVEHLMTQGSANLMPLEHKQLVEAQGGWYSGQTRHDWTGYLSCLPASGLELALWCEADRMRGLTLTEAGLRSQIGVVEQEIRGNILSQPYGGFPCFQVDATVFETWENSHDGYGAFADLETMTLERAAAFVAEHQQPSNACLAVAGDVTVAEAGALIERHFAGIPDRGTVPRVPAAEPPLTVDRFAELTDRLAERPAVALGWRAPSLTADTDLAELRLLLHVLAGGPASLLWRALVPAGEALDIIGALGSLGDWAASLDPAPIALGAHLPADGDPRRSGERVRELILELARSAEFPAAVRSGADDLGLAIRRSRSSSYAAAGYDCGWHLLNGNPARLDEIISSWDTADPDRLAALAERIFGGPFSLVALRPGQP